MVVDAGAGAAAAVSGFLRESCSGFAGLLFSPPLLLPQQLLGLQQDPGIQAGFPREAVARARTRGEPGVLFGRLESLGRWVGPLPGILGRHAGVLSRLPEKKKKDKQEGYL